MKNFRLIGILLATVVFMASSCKKESTLPSDEEQIATYIKDNNLTPIVHPSGINYIITKQGTGTSPTLSSRVTVYYKGSLTDKTVFDQTSSSPITFPLTNVIKGWQIVLPLLKRGGVGTFIIPSTLAYGSNPPSSSIPKNATLVFEIQLVDFN
jgi:FKBP-type peptidyl-prolyl cis-trans isomerase FkpA